LVFDIGGNTGEWSFKLLSRKFCTIWIFEPIPYYVDILRHTFRDRSDVKIFDFGFLDRDISLSIDIDGIASSLYRTGHKNEIVKLRSINDFIKSHNLTKIDLMKINVEGAEFPIIDSLIESGNIKIIQDLQVEFHDFITDAEEKYNIIAKKLSETHYLTYHYSFAWENWRKYDN